MATIRNWEDERLDKKPRNTYLTIAGWMIVLAGVLALVNGAGAILGEGSFGLDFQLHLDKYSACEATIVAMGLVAIAGGVSALKGKHISLAFAGQLEESWVMAILVSCWDSSLLSSCSYQTRICREVPTSHLETI